MLQTGIVVEIDVYKNEDGDFLFHVEELPDDFDNYEDVIDIIEETLEKENKDYFGFISKAEYLEKFVEVIRNKNYKDVQHRASHDLKDIFVEFKKVQE